MESDKKLILNRLATIECHLRAIRKMIEQDRCCCDILSQTYAVERALKAFDAALVDGYLRSRLLTDQARSAEMLRELFEFAPLIETSTASGGGGRASTLRRLTRRRISTEPLKGIAMPTAQTIDLPEVDELRLGLRMGRAVGLC